MESYDSEFAEAGGYGVRRQAADQQREDQVVSITVPQWNGGSTLVVFAVPYSKIREIGTDELTFDQANAIALGPPLVLTRDDFTATNPDAPIDGVEADAGRVAKSYVEDLRDADVSTLYEILEPDGDLDVDELRAAITVLAERMSRVIEPGGAVVEHALATSGGSMHVRAAGPDIEAVFPLKTWIEVQQEAGATVYQRTVVVLNDWAAVPRSEGS